jgi:hypothetical protein
MIFATLLIASVACNSHWPEEDGSRGPRNAVLWATQDSTTDSLTLQHSEQNDRSVTLQAIAGRTMTRSGQTWQAFGTDELIDPGCYLSTMGRLGDTCFGDMIDDEEPIEPGLEASISVPTYGSPSASGRSFFDIAEPPRLSCTGGGDGNGNLRIKVQADETGPLIALVSVKANGQTLREEGVFLNGSAVINLQIPDQLDVTVEARLMDRAGQVGEAETVEVIAPASGCSHSALSALILLGLVGLRRRQPIEG